GTAIVEGGKRAQALAGQGTGTAQGNAAQARADVAQAQANAEADRASYLAWQQRRDAAAHYVTNCDDAMRVASSTNSIPAAIATARVQGGGDPPVGTCDGKPTPTSR